MLVIGVVGQTEKLAREGLEAIIKSEQDAKVVSRRMEGASMDDGTTYRICSADSGMRGVKFDQIIVYGKFIETQYHDLYELLSSFMAMTVHSCVPMKFKIQEYSSDDMYTKVSRYIREYMHE